METELKDLQVQIQNKIYTIRGIQVMLDRDLAELYEVKTKALNQAVKRNMNRFPGRYMFQLTDDEWQFLRSHFVTLETMEESGGRGRYTKYCPYVFTEQGVTQLSAVLRSDVAVEMSVRINDAFHAHQFRWSLAQGVV